MYQYNKIIQKMIKFDVTKANIKEYNPNRGQIRDHLQRILTTGDSESGKINYNILVKFIHPSKIHMKQNINC